MCIPDTSFTFHSDAHDTVSWLDHAVSSFSMHEIISEMDVLHNHLNSDHFPLSRCIQIGAKDECPTGLVDDEKLIKFHKIEWDQLKPAILSNYRQTTDSLLGDIELPDDIVDCSGVNCDNHSHINCLSELYGCIMHCLSKAAGVTVCLAAFAETQLRCRKRSQRSWCSCAQPTQPAQPELQFEVL